MKTILLLLTLLTTTAFAQSAQSLTCGEDHRGSDGSKNSLSLTLQTTGKYALSGSMQFSNWSGQSKPAETKVFSKDFSCEFSSSDKRLFICKTPDSYLSSKIEKTPYIDYRGDLVVSETLHFEGDEELMIKLQEFGFIAHGSAITYSLSDCR